MIPGTVSTSETVPRPQRIAPQQENDSLYEKIEGTSLIVTEVLCAEVRKDPEKFNAWEHTVLLVVCDEDSGLSGHLLVTKSVDGGRTAFSFHTNTPIWFVDSLVTLHTLCGLVDLRSNQTMFNRREDWSSLIETCDEAIVFDEAGFVVSWVETFI